MTWRETKGYLNKINDVLPWLNDCVIICAQIFDYDRIPEIQIGSSDFDTFVQKIGMVPTVDAETNEYKHEGITFMNVHVVCCKFKVE